MSSDDRTQPAFKSLMNTVRSATQAAAQDLPFYKSLDTGLDNSVGECGDKLLGLINQVVQSVVQDQGEVDEVKDLETLQENWSGLSGVLDTLLEKVDIALEEGQSTSHKIEVNENQRKLQSLETEDDKNEKVVKHSRTTERPQDKFARKPDNTRDIPFKPLLTSKPNALEPLDKSLVLVQDEVHGDDVEDGSEGDSLSKPHYKQPYEYEIMNQKYPKLSQKEPQMYHPWESTSYTLVDDAKSLDKMFKELKKSKEIAVDLEHHDYRSFYGFVCLMQISNRDQDWIVDTLKLRDDLQVLNEVFTDPKIIKVFHGASMDINWLQRDFGLYVVSLFDTFHAARALGLSRHGLQYLLEHYAQFQTSKKFQLADWRIRPLPQGMLSYARSDTHFLLYIYDMMRNELIQQGKLDHVLQESRQFAARRYETPGYAVEENGLYNIISKYRMNKQQREVLKVLYDWRDRLARHHDESPRFIMQNHYMAMLCFGQPTTPNAVLNQSNGATSFVRNSAKELAKMIQSVQQRTEGMDNDDDDDDDDGNDVQVKDEQGSHKQLEQNYDAYQREYQKALKAQKKLFQVKLGLGTSRVAASKLFGDDGEDESSEVEKRRELTKEKLQLYVPVPPLAGDAMNEDSESEDEEKETMMERYIPAAERRNDAAQEDEDENENEEDEPHGSSDSKRKLSDDEEETEQKPETDSQLNSKQKRKKRRKMINVVGNDPTIEETDQTKGLQEHDDKNPQAQVPFNAFEYKSAPSVLNSNNGKNNKKDKRKDKKPKKESFNPYKDTDDGPQGAKRRRGPQGTRSITFKSKR